ncbi:unnamed protein product [Rhizoctonia solani]|uniref:Uncharacterized protein n=1 Tax=Rhizoctonia solani TaxID=456999 RepID=A0A8H3A527_9AGAM|nr:unnamed protein product [Rhizoctonia solani]
MFLSTLARLFTLALVLTLSVVVRGVPIETNANLVVRGTCIEKCTTGTRILANMVDLDSKLQPELKSLDDKYKNGADPSANLANIAALFQESTARMATLDKDQTGELNGKTKDIAALYHSIPAEVAMHTAKWTVADEPKKNILGLPSIGSGLANIVQDVGNWAAGVLNAAGTII